MIDRRSFNLGLGAVGLAGSAISQAQPAAAGLTRRAEAEALIRFAETTHPRGLEAKTNDDWQKRVAALLASAGGASYAAYAGAAFRLLSWFRDGHTTLWAGALDQGPFGYELPVRASVFYDGLYIIEAELEAQAMLGQRITDIGSLTTAEYARRFAAIWPADNEAWAHHDMGLLLSTPAFAHMLGAVQGTEDRAVVVRGDSGAAIILRPQSKSRGTRAKVGRMTSPREQWAAEAKGGNYVRRLADRNALYVSLDDLSVGIPAFMQFTSNVFAAMDEPQWGKLIIDLRRNGGGNNFLGEPLRKQIARSRFNRPGGLYVLIGPQTFSAAQNLVNRLERETFAIFAGEPTGGAPRHFGDARPFELAGQTLRGMVSTLPWFDSYPQDKRRWVMPDLLLPRLFADWAAGRDVVLDAVLAHRSSEPPNEASRDRVFYYDRKSQAASWRPFWMAAG